MLARILLLIGLLPISTFAQPAIEPGVSLELAKWRAAHYSDVRYKLNLTLEKMSPVLKGTIEISVRVGENGSGGVKESEPGAVATGFSTPIILDWRRIKGHEEKSTISNVSINGRVLSPGFSQQTADGGPPEGGTQNAYEESNDHLIFRDGVVVGENVIKLDFTSPILTSGSAITRYVDKEDGSEYIYSLFVPSDASTAFPVFDQPDLKARFALDYLKLPDGWKAISNMPCHGMWTDNYSNPNTENPIFQYCHETKPISSYVFAFAVGDFAAFGQGSYNPIFSVGVHSKDDEGSATNGIGRSSSQIYVRRSQAAKFKPHAAEVFRLNREAIKYFEEYFDYKFPFPKYDLVLIPEFPFGGMEHAGATFLRESSIIFPQEPTKNDHISRALLMFHEASHQWFGDTVTMRWFDDLWLKEGFATFTAYKAMEKIMPSESAWKVFYERVKQAAYQTDSTKGTTPIYQEIPNLSAAKSAYGNIVYNKAPAFLRQAEFYLGEDKFQTAVRSFLKKHEFANAGWEDLVSEFESASKDDLKEWANIWVKKRGVPIIKWQNDTITATDALREGSFWTEKLQLYVLALDQDPTSKNVISGDATIVLNSQTKTVRSPLRGDFQFPNYEDYGYGIFLLDEKSRDYVLKNIQTEKDPFLRSMMWGALWDSVREGELDPKQYVELVVKVLSPGFSRPPSEKKPPEGGTQNVGAQIVDDESTVALLLNRVSTAMRYYIDPAGRSDQLLSRVEDLLIERMQKAETLGQRITFYRAFLNVAASEKARGVLKGMLRNAGISAGKDAGVPLKPKDRFDIVTRLIILGDPDGLKLLGELEKTETSDDAKRWAYAARAGVSTAESKAKYWNDFVADKDISESWIEAAFGPWNSIGHERLTLPYLERALKELPNHKRNRKIFFVNGWLGAFIGGQRSEEALALVNTFLADNPMLDHDLRLKVLENVDVIERAVKIRGARR